MFFVISDFPRCTVVLNLTERGHLGALERARRPLSGIFFTTR